MKTILSSFSKLLFATILSSFIFCFGQYVIAQNPTVINDSLVINNRVYAKEKLIVDQEAKFKQDIKVLGSARIQTDLRVDSVLRVDGTAKFFGNVKMEALGTPAVIDSTVQILVVLPNGQIKKIDGSSLNKTQAPVIEDCSGTILNPQWTYQPNKIYSLCPIVKVGIGTSTPAYNLTVEGTSFSHKIIVGIPNPPTSALISGFAYGSGGVLMQLGSDSDVRFLVRGNGSIFTNVVGTNTACEIKNGNGHAVVVYANDGSKIFQLQNDGLLRTREIRVDAATWADFVFEKDYDLPKLKDVAKFIEANHRLPGVPSSKEIKENGINLGDMQTLQMQKIEELTLYMIAMDEKMATMQNEINVLKEENTELKKSSNK